MKKPLIVLAIIGTFTFNSIFAGNITITVNTSDAKKAVSPYLYGLNNGFDEPDQFYKDVGVKFSRMNQGNNATKYNWKKKMTSHPDWYNNVYANDWDKKAQHIQDNFSDMQGMFAFQLLGRVASSTDYNFDANGYNNSAWWEGVTQNLAGGGIVNTADKATKALQDGNANLYTQEWPADSSVGILDHWFGSNGIGLDKERFAYWSMDNEADIWEGTHDDVMPKQLSAGDFMDRFIELAKKARKLYPGIKICGPVSTSEWFWYRWSGEGTVIDGKNYCFMEYFIKRLADEEKASGVKLLDVVDIHNYPYAENGDESALQLHRMYYDTEYIYAGANGVKAVDGGWDNSLNKEYIFKRINDWLDEYYGAGHGITTAVSEWSPATSEPNATSVVYASHLGTFANNSVEFFSPWSWFVGMWETLHLFSRYSKEYSVSSLSSNENLLSAYTTVSGEDDSITVMIVNRDMSASQNVTVTINQFPIENGDYGTLQLANLPSTETFVSHTDNALVSGSVTVASNSFTITVPKLSTTAVLLAASPTSVVSSSRGDGNEATLFPNPTSDILNIKIRSGFAEPTMIVIYDQVGNVVQSSVEIFDGCSPLAVDVSSLAKGCYTVSVHNNSYSSKQVFSVTERSYLI